MAVVVALVFAATVGREAPMVRREEMHTPAVAASVKREAPAKAAPSLTAEAFRQRREMQVEEKRLEQTRDLEQIIALSPPAAELPSLLFHLAELEAEQARYLALQRPQMPDAARPRALREQAVARYRQALAQAPGFEHADEVLFFEADVLRELGRDDEAVAVLEELARRFPQSALTPDAWLAIGERWFEAGDVARALPAYEQAARRTGTNVYGYALYKQAWCHFNQRAYGRAAQLFRAVVLYGRATFRGATTGDPRLALVREARKDYVLNFSQSRAALEAWEDFRDLEADSEAPMSMLAQLGDLYFTTGHDRDACEIYRRLVADKPDAPEAVLYQARIVAAVARTQNKRETMREAARLVERIASSGVSAEEPASLATGGARMRGAKAEAIALAEQTLRTLAAQYHNEAKKSDDPLAWEAAAAMYDNVLLACPQAESAYELHFYFGELLFQRGKFAAAAAQYRAAVEIDAARTDGKKGRWFAEAAYDWVLGADAVARSRVPDDQNLLAACESFLQQQPNSVHAVEVGYRAARIYAKVGQSQRAVELFTQIALAHPESELSEFSANLALDSLNAQHNYAALNALARRFAANDRLVANGKLRDDLQRVIEESAFKLVEAQPDPRQAAESYRAFVEEFGRSPLAARALFNAAALLAKARLSEEAIALRDRLFSDYPASPLVPACLLTNSEAHAALADYAEAARDAERYADGFAKESASLATGRARRRGAEAENEEEPASLATGGERRRGAVEERASSPRGNRSRGQAPVQDKRSRLYDMTKAQAALLDAALYREALGQVRATFRDRALFVSLWPKAPESTALLHSLAQLQVQLHDLPAARAHLTAWARATVEPPELRGPLVRAEVAVASGIATPVGRRAALEAALVTAYRKLPKKQRATVTGAPLSTVAEAALATVRAARRSLEATPLVAPLARSAERKATALVEVQKRAAEVVTLQVAPPAVCALAELGQALVATAHAFAKVPVPDGLTKNQVDLYRAALAKRTAILEGKAIEALTGASTKARELQIYSDCAVQARATLAQLLRRSQLCWGRAEREGAEHWRRSQLCWGRAEREGAEQRSTDVGALDVRELVPPMVFGDAAVTEAALILEQAGTVSAKGSGG